MLVYQRVNKKTMENHHLLIDKSTINGHFQWQTVSLPVGISLTFYRAYRVHNRISNMHLLYIIIHYCTCIHYFTCVCIIIHNYTLLIINYYTLLYIIHTSHTCSNASILPSIHPYVMYMCMCRHT